MANKTIHELTELTQGNVGTSQELAIYDVSDNSTKRVTVGNLFGIDEFLTADDDDEPTGQVDFTSEDDELNPTSTESVDLLTGNDSWSQRFYKVSQMFKNIRYILGKLGTTNISSIGNGTVTGAISELVVTDLSNQVTILSSHVSETPKLYCYGGHFYQLIVRIDGSFDHGAWRDICGFSADIGPLASTAGIVAHGNSANLLRGSSCLVHPTRLNFNLNSALSSTSDYIILTGFWIH